MSESNETPTLEQLRGLLAEIASDSSELYETELVDLLTQVKEVRDSTRSVIENRQLKEWLASLLDPEQAQLLERLLRPLHELLTEYSKNRRMRITTIVARAQRSKGSGRLNDIQGFPNGESILAGDAVELTEQDLLCTLNVGPKLVKSLKDALNKIGLRYGMKLGPTVKANFVIVAGTLPKKRIEN